MDRLECIEVKWAVELPWNSGKILLLGIQVERLLLL
jgi:hypothetical protein